MSLDEILAERRILVKQLGDMHALRGTLSARNGMEQRMAALGRAQCELMPDMIRCRRKYRTQ